MKKAVAKSIINFLLCLFIFGGCVVHMEKFHATADYGDMLDSTVLIEIDGRHTGSGFVVEVSGSEVLIITARHVVDREGNYAVVFSDNSKRSVQSMRISKEADCAVLLVRKTGLRPLKITTKLSVGQPVLVIGSPLDPKFFNYVTRGIVSKIGVMEDELSNNSVTMIDAAANGGNSGGPVFNLRGEVVGILIAGYIHNCGVNFITPATDLLRLLQDFADEGADCEREEIVEECPSEEYAYGK